MTPDQLREEIASMFIEDGEHFEKTLDAIMSRIAEHDRYVIGEDKDLTIKDIFGDDPRNNIGGQEIEARNHMNSARRKLRIEQKKRAGL